MYEGVSKVQDTLFCFIHALCPVGCLLYTVQMGQAALSEKTNTLAFRT